MFNSVVPFNIHQAKPIPLYHCPGTEEDLDAEFDEVEVLYIDQALGDYQIQLNDHKIRWCGRTTETIH